MFTWEEAGQLRSMLLIVVWGVVLGVAAIVFVEREPILGAFKGGVHRIESGLHLSSHG